jgi:hypothetical protein
MILQVHRSIIPTRYVYRILFVIDSQRQRSSSFFGNHYAAVVHNLRPCCTTASPIRWSCCRNGGTTTTNRTRNQWNQRHDVVPSSIMSIVYRPYYMRTHCFSSSTGSNYNSDKILTTTTQSDDEIQRRLDTFKDLYVVARDCMEDLLTNAQQEDDSDDDNDDYNIAMFLQHITYVQESVEAALQEYENLLQLLQDHPEQRNGIEKSYGFKMKQLQLEMTMLLQNVNDQDDDDDNDDDDDDHNETIRINGGNQEDDDDDDDLEYEDEDDDDDDIIRHDDKK